jgi:hypothetical protein
VLRRAQQRRLGWMEAHDADLRVQERALARELGWRGRVDQRALVLDPPAWLLAELGPVPTDPQERAVWRIAAAELDAYRRTYGLDHPGRPSMSGAGWPGTGGRLHRPRSPPPSGPAGAASSGSATAVASAPIAAATSGGGRPQPPTGGAGSTRSGCWAPKPAAIAPAAAATGTPPGPRWSTWPAGAATAASATSGIRTANDPAAASAARNATAASWQEGVSHASAPRPRRVHHDQDLDRYDVQEEEEEELGTPLYKGSGLSVRALTAEELQRFLDAHAGRPPS